MKASVEDLLQILSHSPIATAVYNSPELHIAYANKQMLRFWNRDEQLINKKLGDCFPDEFFIPFLAILKKVWQNGESVKRTNSPARVMLNGEFGLYYFDYEYKAIVDSDGRTRAIIHTAIDVSEKVLNEKTIHDTEERVKHLNKELLHNKFDIEQLINKLTNSDLHIVNDLEHTLPSQEQIFQKLKQEERMNFALQSAQMGTWTLNFKTKKIFWDNFTQHILGQKVDQYVPYEELFQHVHVEDRSKVAQAIQNALESPYKSKVDIVYRSVGSFTQKPKWLHSKGRVYFDEQNQPIFLSGTLMDVSEQYLQREKFEIFHKQVLQREKELRQVLEAAEVGIFMYKLSTHDIQINSHAKALLGVDDKIAITISNLLLNVHPDCVELIYKTFHHCNETKEPFDIQIEIIAPHDGSSKWIRVLGTINPDIEYPQDVIHAVLINITTAKEEEKRKMEFLSIASHELKTPLTSLNAFLQLLILKGDSLQAEQRKHYLELAFNQSKRIKSLIERFLNVSQLNESKLIIKKEKTTLQVLMRNIRDMYSIHRNFERLHFQEVEDIPLFIDVLKIEEVINNFINNALKYSPQDYPVHISTSKQGQVLTFTVKDFGQGVSPQDSKQIFNKFYRVNNKENMLVSGFGIGLYICKEIIQMHQGEIGVYSDGKTGSAFWFSIPIGVTLN